MITQQTIEKIKHHTDIVAVIAQFVKLTKKGTSYRGLCPFHEEHNPSFSVSPSKGIYKCFSCGETGDAISFLMRHEAMSFEEAMRHLAAKAGIEIEETEWSPEEKKRHEARECFFLLNELGSVHFRNQMNRPEAQIFLSLREIDPATAERFALGFAPDSDDLLLRTLTRKGYASDLLLNNGLLCYNQVTAKAMDRFRNRLIFPIRNVAGRIVAFGGRRTDNNPKIAKYHNSPETPYYHKGRELYGLFEGRKAIAKHENCFVVEGYTDVLRLSALGVEETVAPLGTALTREQAKLLKRFTHGVTIMTDSDDAGKKAAWAMLKLFLTEGFEVWYSPLPQNEDPDSYCRGIAKDELSGKLYSERQDAIIWFAMQIWLRAEQEPSRKAKALQDIVGLLGCVSDPVRRHFYVEKVSELTGFRDQRALDPKSYTQAPKPLGLPTAKELTTRERNERRLISWLINRGSERLIVPLENGETWQPDVREFVDAMIESEDIQWDDPLHRRIWNELKVVHIPEEISYELYYMHHPNEEVAELARELPVPETTLTDDPVQEIRSLLIAIKLSDLDKTIVNACRELSQNLPEEHLQRVRSVILKMKKEWHMLRKWMEEGTLTVS